MICLSSVLCPLVSSLFLGKSVWMETVCSHTCGLWGHLRVCSMAGVFSEKSKKFVRLWGTSYLKDLLHLRDYLFNPRGKGQLLSLLCLYARKRVTFKGQPPWFWFGPCLCWISASIPENLRFFLPPPFLLFLFSVNSSCRSNIDKYSRECFSGRRMLPKHFLTIFGKNWSFCVFQRNWKRGRPLL